MVTMKKVFLILAYTILHSSLGQGQTTVYFSPDQKPTTQLLELIKTCKRQLYAAIYMFTDQRIAKAVIDAKSRGVDVQVIVDQISFEGSYGKAEFLKNNNISTWVFFPPVAKKRSFYNSSLMHNKFAVIDDKVVTGSFNWTVAADRKNRENMVVITNEPQIVALFTKEFHKIKTECIYYSAHNRSVNSQPFFNRIRKAVSYIKNYLHF